MSRASPDDRPTGNRLEGGTHRGKRRLAQNGALGLIVGAPAALAATVDADPTTPAYPSRGAFVIGDRNASVGSEVTFWGAQWWEDNRLSLGAAPPAFTGFADTPCTTATCGPFTTTPGNGSAPPAGPLPPVMLALVTSSVTQSGSMISGNVVGIAVIDTDPGYEPDPKRAGTGTVLGFIPWSSLRF